ncbi:hypothetical protein GW17_00047240, partial [Ensete ventricosum]
VRVRSEAGREKEKQASRKDICVDPDPRRSFALISGVVSITMDAEKSTVTVVGDVDVVLIVKALRKKKRPAQVVSVGEPGKEKEEEKKAEQEEEPSKPLPSCCTACKVVVVWSDEPNPCSIL